MTKSFYQFREPWEHILPDGMQFCHWGGKEFSERLVKKLDVKSDDAVLELCCGQGGTLNLLPTARQIVGIDISPLNIAAATKTLTGKPVDLRTGDICEELSRFPDENFTKLFSQDGDAWMHPSKHIIMSEVFRVTAKGGLFIFQSYVCSKLMPDHALIKTEKFLHDFGYIDADVPRLEEIPKMFQIAGFRIESFIPLHKLYSEDNLRMLKHFEENRETKLKKFPKTEIEDLERWLKWGKTLFSEGWWSGILVVAKKD